LFATKSSVSNPADVFARIVDRVFGEMLRSIMARGEQSIITPASDVADESGGKITTLERSHSILFECYSRL
jgi:hypothetical protein